MSLQQSPDSANADQENISPKKRRPTSSGFDFLNIFVSILSMFLGILSSITANYLWEFAQHSSWLAWILVKIHWMVLFSAAMFLYTSTCYYVEVNKKYYGMSNIFRIPVWTELRNLGDQKIARLSYVALVFIPLVVFFITSNPVGSELIGRLIIPLNLKISFFISFFLSLALLIFTVGCPSEFVNRKTTSENGKIVNLILQNATHSPINIVQDESDYVDVALDNTKLTLRYFCWTFYCLGLAYATVILFRAARLVLYS